MKVKLKRKVKNAEEEIIPITGEYIKLDSLLKFALIAESGGQAKIMISDGIVMVNGIVCTQRGKKIYSKDYVEVMGKRLIVEGQNV